MDNTSARLVLTLGLILGAAALAAWTYREHRLAHEGYANDSGASADTDTDPDTDGSVA